MSAYAGPHKLKSDILSIADDSLSKHQNIEKRHPVTKTSPILPGSIWIKFWTQLNSRVPKSNSKELPGDQNNENFKLL